MLYLRGYRRRCRLARVVRRRGQHQRHLSRYVMSIRDSTTTTTSQLISFPGLFAGTIGVRRLLKMFERYNIKTTWFIPGHSLETFPEECRMIADAGHEIGLHGYSHENPIAMTLEQQTAIMDKVRENSLIRFTIAIRQFLTELTCSATTSSPSSNTANHLAASWLLGT